MATVAQDLPRRSDTSTVLPIDRWGLAILQRKLGDAPVRFVLWDGTEASSDATPQYRILIRDRETLFKVLWNPDLNFGEAFMAGRLEVEGDLLSALEAMFRARRLPGRTLLALAAPLRRSNTLSESRENIHHHYDLGNDFYSMWLDEQLVYTCAYFPTPEATLEAAQVAKMHHVCRKIRLQPDERVVEAGCGWGALALHMARHYGATVKAFNISREQIRYARERAAREGLSGRVEFIEDDYRSISGTFDVFMSVGMLEHVGLKNYHVLGRLIDMSIDRRHGRGLLHFIGRNRPGALNPWIRKRIFPGAYPPTLRQVMDRILEPHNLSVLDVENLRLHYARTLQHWLERFDASSNQISKMFDASFVRAWRLYLAGSKATFTAGALQLFQITFARGASNEIPWIRQGYSDEEGERSRLEGSGDLVI